jgi:DNA ligase 1
MADLADGESVEMKGSGAKPYVLKNVGGVYSCSCPAWRNQSTAIERRSCKHLRKLRGGAAEDARIGQGLPPRPEPEGEDGPGAGADKAGPPLLLAERWDTAQDLAGWWLSEKLDGVRAYWDGTALISRLGNRFHAPDWFPAGLPEIPLDGELWIDRKAFQRTVGIVRRQDKTDLWKQVRYVAFASPRDIAKAADESLIRIVPVVVRISRESGFRNSPFQAKVSPGQGSYASGSNSPPHSSISLCRS